MLTGFPTPPCLSGVHTTVNMGVMLSPSGHSRKGVVWCISKMFGYLFGARDVRGDHGPGMEVSRWLARMRADRG